jgi:hypothetical protein
MEVPVAALPTPMIGAPVPVKLVADWLLTPAEPEVDVPLPLLDEPKVEEPGLEDEPMPEEPPKVELELLPDDPPKVEEPELPDDPKEDEPKVELDELAPLTLA